MILLVFVLLRKRGLPNSRVVLGEKRQLNLPFSDPHGIRRSSISLGLISMARAVSRGRGISFQIIAARDFSEKKGVKNLGSGTNQQTTDELTYASAGMNCREREREREREKERDLGEPQL